jgi:glycosyltransferase involved in cell wall biosynthesis
MRTVHFIHRFWPCTGGSEGYLLKLAQALRAASHNVEVVTTNASAVEALWRAGQPCLKNSNEEHESISIHRFPIRYFPLHTYTRKALSKFAFMLPPYLGNPNSPWIPGMMKFASESEQHCDVVHCTALPYDGVLFPALKLATRMKAPLICTPFVHIGEPGNDAIARHYSRPHQIDLLKQCRAVIVQTQQESDFLAAKGINKERLHIIPQGFSAEETAGGDAERFRSEHRCLDNIVVHMATLCHDKGTDAMIEAYNRLRKETPFTLVLVGRMTREFEQWYGNLPRDLRDEIIHLQGLSDPQRNDLLAAIDVLALPSRTDTFGRVFLEAWSYKKPVIGARAGGIPGVIDHGENGLLADYGNIPQLCDALRDLLEEPDTRQRMGEAGYAKLWDRYSWEKISKQLVGLFEEVAGQP